MRQSVIVVLIVFLLSTLATAEQMSVTCTDDWGEESGVPLTGSNDSYICERGEYEAYYRFDLSGIPDAWRFEDMTLTVSVGDSDAGQRTLWVGSTLVGTTTLGSSSTFSYVDIAVDVDALAWSGEDSVTFMLTGPLDGSHICASAEHWESGNPAILAVTNPEPGTCALFGGGLLAAFAALVRRRRQARRA